MTLWTRTTYILEGDYPTEIWKAKSLGLTSEEDIEEDLLRKAVMELIEEQQEKE